MPRTGPKLIQKSPALGGARNGQNLAQRFMDNIQNTGVVEPEWKSNPKAWLCGIDPWDAEKPHIRQQEFCDKIFNENVKDILYGGAKMGGKTTIIVRPHIKLALENPGRETGVMRHVKKSLLTTTWKELVHCARWLRDNCGLRYDFIEDKMLLVLHTHEDEALCPKFWGFEGADPEKWQGANLDGWIIDEGVQIEDEAWAEAWDRLRGSLIGLKNNYKLLMTIGSNQGNGYLMEEYHDPYMEGKLQNPEIPGEYDKYLRRAFIPATVHDNPAAGAEYKNQMLYVRGEKALRDREGVWGNDKAIVFHDRHPDTFKEFDVQAIIGCDNLRDVDSFGGYDYGVQHDGAFLVGVERQGILWIVHEMIVEKAELPQWASEMMKFPRCHIYADKSITWMRNHHSASIPIIEELRLLGAKCVPANEGDKHHVGPTAHMMQRGFSSGVIRIHPKRCPKLVRAVKAWKNKMDPKRKDVLLDGQFEEKNKDAIDALRYIYVNRWRGLALPKFATVYEMTPDELERNRVKDLMSSSDDSACSPWKAGARVACGAGYK